MTQDELYRLPPDRCIVMIKGQKPFLDYKINPDTCLNFSSDLFTVQGKHGRKLKPEYLYPINDKDPEHPARKRTANSYRKGVEQSVEIDEEQKERRKRDMEEDEKYDPVPREPMEPEVKPIQEVLHLDEMESYEPAGCYDGRRATVEELFDEDD